MRSDASRGPTFTLIFDKAGTKEVSTYWAFPPGAKGRRWQTLKVLAPNEVTSEKVAFNFDLQN